MAVIYVTYADGTEDRFGTEGGETDALAADLAADPKVRDLPGGLRRRDGRAGSSNRPERHPPATRDKVE